MEYKAEEKQNKRFFQKYIYKWDKRFFLSTLAIIFGVMAIISGGTTGQGSENTAGWVMVLGALAYRSAKKRKLGLSAPSIIKQIMEVLALVFAFFLVCLQNDIHDLIVNEPFTNLVIPVCALTAYLFIVCDKFYAGDRTKKIILVGGTFFIICVVAFYAIYTLTGA